MTKKKPQAGQHLRMLSDDARNALEQLNADARIGPATIKGDGNIIAWHHHAVLIGEVEFSRTVPGLVRKATFDCVCEDPPRIVGESKGKYLFRALRLRAFAQIDAIYADISGEQWEAWSRLYDGVLAPEMAAQWGGRHLRLRQAGYQPMTSSKTPGELVEEALKASVPIPEIPGRVGISRATLFRIMRKKKD